MKKSTEKLPLGNIDLPALARAATDIGKIVREQRRRSGLRQVDLAGIGNTGNRLIVDIEKGKPTVQIQKVLDVLELLGLELIIQRKSSSVG